MSPKRPTTLAGWVRTQLARIHRDDTRGAPDPPANRRAARRYIRRRGHPIDRRFYPRRLGRHPMAMDASGREKP